jgi:hypothetical protein
MLDHHTNAGFMQFEIFAKGERFSHQIGTPLPQCVVQSLDMIGFTGLFRHWAVAFGRKHTRIGTPLISLDNRALPIRSWQRLPQFTAGFGRTVTKGETNDFAGLAFKSHPYPDFVTL